MTVGQHLQASMPVPKSKRPVFRAFSSVELFTQRWKLRRLDGMIFTTRDVGATHVLSCFFRAQLVGNWCDGAVGAEPFECQCL